LWHKNSVASQLATSFVYFHESSFEDCKMLHFFIIYQYGDFIFRVGCVSFPFLILNRVAENNRRRSLSSFSTSPARCVRFSEVLAIFMRISSWRLRSCSRFHRRPSVYVAALQTSYTVKQVAYSAHKTRSVAATGKWFKSNQWCLQENRVLVRYINGENLSFPLFITVLSCITLINLTMTRPVALSRISLPTLMAVNRH
jgi:hypothetical protein